MEISDSKPETSNSFVSGVKDFFQAAAYSFAQRPIDGVEQLVDHVAHVDLPHLSIVAAPTHQNWETVAGSIVGTVGDAVLIGAGVGAAVEGLGLASTMAAMPLAEAGAIRGGAMGVMFGLVSPVSDDANYWTTKSKAVATTALGFAAGGAVAAPLSHAIGESLPARIGTKLTKQLTSGTTKVLFADLLNWRAPTLSEVPYMLPYVRYGLTK